MDPTTTAEFALPWECPDWCTYHDTERESEGMTHLRNVWEGFTEQLVRDPVLGGDQLLRVGGHWLEVRLCRSEEPGNGPERRWIALGTFVEVTILESIKSEGRGRGGSQMAPLTTGEARTLAAALIRAADIGDELVKPLERGLG